MQPCELIHKIQLLGEINETFEQDGHRIAKVILKSCCFDIDAAGISDLHLGQTVVIDLDMTVRRIEKTRCSNNNSIRITETLEHD